MLNKIVRKKFDIKKEDYRETEEQREKIEGKADGL